MRNSFEVWCETVDISVSKIESLVVDALMNNRNNLEFVFISADLAAELYRTFIPYARLNLPTANSGLQSITLHTSGGALQFKILNKLRNFLMIGCEEDYEVLVQAGIDPIFWSDQERALVDKEFEKIVLG